MFFLSKFFKLDQEYMNALSHAGVIGLHMVSGIAVGTGIGYLLDRWLETSPWLTGVFMIVGIVAGFKNVYVDTKKLVRSQENAGMSDSSQGRSDATETTESEREQSGDDANRPGR